MALTEISANVRKNGSQARRSAHESSQSKSPKMVKPDAVSNMLRTSTETGDIGQFSVCPWRLPRSASQHPTRSRSGSVSAAGAAFGTYARRPMPRHGAHFSPRPVPSLPALSRHDSVRSSLASFNSNTRTRCRAAPSIQYRPDRMASQAKVSGLHSQPSFLSLRGRPGSRRASPAFGEAQSMPMYSSRPGFHRAASVATATSSPASMFHGGLPYSYREVNKSASSFHSRLPSPAMPGAHPGVRRSPFPSRTATPASVSLHHTSTKHLTGSVESFPSMQGSTAGSTIPLYYDYTEAFAEEDCKFPHQEIPISSPSSANHTIPEQEAARPTGQVHNQSGIVWRSASKQSERLTQHNPGHSERLKGGSREEKVVQNSEQNESKEIEKHSSGKPEVGLNFSSSQPFKLGLTDKEIPNEHSRRLSEEPPQDTDPDQQCGLSRRMCSTSLSPPTFPNASRNSGDLTSLAARARSPTPENTLNKDIGRAGDSKEMDGDSKLPGRVDEQVVSRWQLPSLDLKPLSFLRHSRRSAERSRSSDPSSRSNPPAIISPTPERPLSSHGRRRFSKILGMEDSGCSPSYSPATISKSDNSLNIGKLRPAWENSEASYPARYSIPSFSPRNSVIAESARGNESHGGGSDQEQGSGCEKSTVESLLDKHIQCLDLQPETRSELFFVHNFSDNGDTPGSTVSTSRGESTMKITAASAPKRWPLALTISSASASTTASPEGQTLVPRRCFSPAGHTRPRPVVAQLGPCVSRASPHSSSSRQSFGWNTLALTSELSTPIPALSQCPVKGKSAPEEDAPSNAEARESSTSPVSSSLPSFGSGDSESLYNWNNSGLSKRRSVLRALERQISYHRRMRMRLKLKRNSRSQDRIYASEYSLDPSNFHTTRASSRDWASVLEPSFEQHATALDSHGAVNTVRSPEHASSYSLTEHTSRSDRPAMSLDVPNRRSSVVATGSRQVKHSIDMTRKMSRRVIRSQHSNASAGDPLNTPRLSAVAPHLATPYQGRPPKPMSLNLDFAFPPVPIIAPPGLGATQSFFSDDSSAVQNPRRSLRKRFNLTGLRSVLPSSPGIHSAANALGEKPEAGHRWFHPSGQMRGPRREDEKSHLDGTVGMSEFAYCRRKMLERVKGWWRRHKMQGKLGLKREKGERKPRQSW
jgi:hypothetical protein